MHLVDLHCDTLYKAVTQNISLDDNAMEVKCDIPDNSKRLQCYAIWIPDDLSSDYAEKLFFTSSDMLEKECKRLDISLVKQNDKINDVFNDNQSSAIFTVENAKALNGKLENVSIFAKLGIKIMTLTWNASNQIGDGAGVDNTNGITDFGKIVVSEMEKNGIVVDISHASDRLFYDVAEIASKPFVATHSNLRSVADNKRNLTDEQFKIIVQTGGIVGINLHKDFLSDKPEDACKYDIIRHIDRFLSLGGENSICFGTDFDGCDLPKDIKGSETMDEICEMLLKHNYNEGIIRKIFYKNALNFFENFDNGRIM